MGLTVNGMPVFSDALRALAAVKKGVSNVIHSTAIPWSRKTRPASVLSSPPEHNPKARIFLAGELIFDSFLRGLVVVIARNEETKQSQDPD